MTLASLAVCAPGRAGAAVRMVPAGIAADCSRNVQAELSDFINRAPAGTTVRFPRGGCYAQSNRIEVRGKSRLTIDGNGSTFRSAAENTGRIVAPNWMLLRAHGVRIENMTVVGNFAPPGPRSQARVNEIETAPATGAQNNAGISVYGGDGVWIRDLDIRNVFGDAVLTGISQYVDATTPFETPRNVHVQRVSATTTARHCFSPDQVVGFWLEDSVGRDCWYGGLDAELDAASQSISDVHLLRNTFDGFFEFGILIPVAGDADSTANIEIRGNRFLTGTDYVCNPVIQVGAYPTNANSFKNVVVEDNQLTSSGIAIELDHVLGGRVQRNRVAYTEAACGSPGGPLPSTRVTNSTGVLIGDNGPDAVPNPTPAPPAPVPPACSVPDATGDQAPPADEAAPLPSPAPSGSNDAVLRWRYAQHLPSVFDSFTAASSNATLSIVSGDTLCVTGPPAPPGQRRSATRAADRGRSKRPDRHGSQSPARSRGSGGLYVPQNVR